MTFCEILRQISDFLLTIQAGREYDSKDIAEVISLTETVGDSGIDHL